MRDLIKNTKSAFCISLVFIFLISISGFSIYQHTCSHSQTEDISIIFPSATCNHAQNENKESSCCGVTETKSCCDTQGITKDKNCCHDNQEFKKLDTIFVLLNNNIDFNDLSSFIIQLFSSPEYTLFKTYNLQTLITKKEAPPLIITSEYLAKIQVYLI